MTITAVIDSDTAVRATLFLRTACYPWSAAGVYTTLDPPSRDEGNTSHTVVQNITHDGSIVSLVLDLGAHHLDLMFAHPDDPPCANEARLIQEEHIRNWIQEWNLGEQTCVRT
mmetsp:Transcript_12619/g.12709  ORF Transcript_12619/g.12709 Transcript_12619/m.12709 type:complete len:113 (-) Transcript_12619:159-497(-)